MPQFGLRQLKFGILRVLANSSRRTEHKRTIIGRGEVSRGTLEELLATRFDAADRALADRAFEQLKSADLLRAPGGDLADPEQWVEITEAGRAALDRNSLDELDAALYEIAPNLVEIRDGAWSAVASAQPDSLRQAAHSAREMIDQVVQLAAPDESLRAEPGFTPDAGSRNGITRKMRLKYILKRRRGAVSDSTLRVAEEACELVLAIDNQLTAMSHGRSQPSEHQVRDAITAAEIALRAIFLPA